jgi:sialidase-1
MSTKNLFARLIAITLAILGLLLIEPFHGAVGKAAGSDQTAPEPEQTDLFVGGEGAYPVYRIPALVTTPKGTVLAFVEGRKDGWADHGHIEILMRRSTDGGRTWAPAQLILRDGTNALNNPTAVVDRDTGTIWLLLIRTSTKKYKNIDEIAKATGRVSDMWAMHSDDEGATWAGPTDITKSLTRRGWNRVVPGPGVGIQLRSGRLVIPCTHFVGELAADHIIYSDDHGKHWRLGGSTEEKTDEDQIVELTDGSLMLNMRNYQEKGHRALAISKDGGLTWSKVTSDPTLIEPTCEASLIRYTTSPPSAKNRLLFSNPASNDRVRMTVRLSYDEGKTWPVAKLLNAGGSAYSCLTVLPDMQIGCLYERGRHHAAEKVTFARFSLPWLTDGADSLDTEGR